MLSPLGNQDCKLGQTVLYMEMYLLFDNSGGGWGLGVGEVEFSLGRHQKCKQMWVPQICAMSLNGTTSLIPDITKKGHIWKSQIYHRLWANYTDKTQLTQALFI